MIAKRSLRGRSPRFSRGSGGMLPRKILKIETVKYAILHIYCKKNRPYVHMYSFLRSEENSRRMNNLNALLYRFFVWITACHGRVHEKWPNDTEETWILTEEQRKQAKSGFKTVFWALIGTNRDESAFLGSRAGRRGSVSKSGQSRRERDGWQVC